MAALRDLRLSARTVLPAALLSVRFARSGGPGGQNVNKVASKVDLRLDLEGAREFLGDERLERVRRVLESRLDGDGNLQVVSSEHREQARNVDAALDRMEAMLIEALRPPKPRHATRPTRASKVRRLDAKRQRGEVKRGRGRTPEG